MSFVYLFYLYSPHSTIRFFEIWTLSVFSARRRLIVNNSCQGTVLNLRPIPSSPSPTHPLCQHLLTNSAHQTTNLQSLHHLKCINQSKRKPCICVNKHTEESAPTLCKHSISNSLAFCVYYNCFRDPFDSRQQALPIFSSHPQELYRQHACGCHNTLVRWWFSNVSENVALDSSLWCRYPSLKEL